MKKVLIMAVLIVSMLVSTGVAQAVTLTWDANTDTDLAGYRVYRSTVSGSYSKELGKVCDVVKPAVTCVVPNPTVDGTYYFVATAYDTAGNESGFSNEVSYVLNVTPPVIPKNLRLTP